MRNVHIRAGFLFLLALITSIVLHISLQLIQQNIELIDCRKGLTALLSSVYKSTRIDVIWLPKRNSHVIFSVVSSPKTSNNFTNSNLCCTAELEYYYKP